jgi:hypothetical protein
LLYVARPLILAIGYDTLSDNSSFAKLDKLTKVGTISVTFDEVQDIRYKTEGVSSDTKYRSEKVKDLGAITEKALKGDARTQQVTCKYAQLLPQRYLYDR